MPVNALRPAEASDQPAAVAHQLAIGQLVHLAPGLDAALVVEHPERPVPKLRMQQPHVPPYGDTHSIAVWGVERQRELLSRYYIGVDKA